VRAKELLATTDKTVSEITYEVGFKELAYFSRFFQKNLEFLLFSFGNTEYFTQIELY